MSLTGPRWVVHVPITAPDGASAVLAARAIAQAMDEFSIASDGLSAELSREDDQALRVPLFCNRDTPAGRCDLPASPRHRSDICGPQERYRVVDNT